MELHQILIYLKGIDCETLTEVSPKMFKNEKWKRIDDDKTEHARSSDVVNEVLRFPLILLSNPRYKVS